MFLANCCVWLLYGAAIADPFIFCAVRWGQVIVCLVGWWTH